MKNFLKRNQSNYSDQLYKEVTGLEHLRKFVAQDLKIPMVHNVNDDNLELEQISSTRFDQIGYQKLGKLLAQLHQVKGDIFGFDEDNYIGLNPQINTKSDNWGEFFLKQRLSIQVDFINSSSLQEKFHLILLNETHEIIDFLNFHNPHPSPLHGDLWSGNTLYDGENPWLIDPAFYFGDREVDIAMTQMFGGFTKDFYKSYDEEYPLATGYKKRFEIYNLYHYLNHFNLFGGPYLDKCHEGFKIIQNLN